MTATTSGSTLRIGILLVLVTAVVSGVSTFVNAYAVGSTSSDAFVTVRNLAVAGMLVPVVALAAVRAAPRPALGRSDWMRLLAIGLLGGALPFPLFFHGLALAAAAGGATTASFLYRTLFLFAGVLGLAVLRERFRWPVLAGAALLLAGSYLLLSWTSPVWTDGSLYVLAATLLWAGEYTLSKATLARGIPSGTVALGRMGFGAAALSGYLALTAQWGHVAAFSPAEWGWVGLSALLLTAFVATWYAGLARVDLSVAAAVLVLGYPVTWLLAVGIQHTAPTWTAALGVASVALGVAVYAAAPRIEALGRRVWRALIDVSPRPR
jgi:drug/metabolite transporter (DMT)-like permease